MDLTNQSLDDQDELRGVEALEDILDVENEMGFGEGEEWSRDDNSVGYSKLAASRKGALNKASCTAHARPRLAIHPHRSGKPLTVVRHGVLKHGVPSFDGDEKPKVPVSARASGVKRTFVSSSDGVGKLKMKEEVTGDTNDLLEVFEHNEVDTDPSLRCSQVDEGMQGFDTDSDTKGLDRSVHVCGASKHNGVERKTDGEIIIKPDERGTGEEHVQKEAKKGMGKLDERTNRVRFSLEFEPVPEKVTGFANKGGSDAKEKTKCSKPREWQYVRSMPSDSHGFGTPKGPIGVPVVRATSTKRRKEPEMTESDLKDPSLGFDLAKALKMRDDKKVARLAQERVDRLEDSMLKQQEIVANMRLFLAHEGTKDYAKLRQLVDSLDQNIRKVTVLKVRQVPHSYELKNRVEQISRLKAQCNLLEMDRERLKKKLRHLLEKADGKEREQDALTTNRGPDASSELDASSNEQEKLLERKVRDLESSLEEWESKFKKVEADFAIERALLEDSLNECKLDWRNKQQRWVLKMKEREAELSHMKSSQDKLVDLLMSCRQCIDKLRKEAASCGANTPREGENTLPGCIEEINALNLALAIQCDMESLRQSLAESSSLVLQRELRLQPDVLKQESKVLENKVAETISLMNQLKQEMKAKEHQIRKENEQYAQSVAEKVKHVEALEAQLADKEHDIEGFMQELKDEVSLLNKELECERRERSRLSDMQGNMKYKLMKGLRKKEQKLEEEMEGMKEKMDELTASMAHKDERIARLQDEVTAKTAQLVHEKQKWNMAIKEVKQKAAKTILRFMHGKENGLLEHIRERRKGHKTVEGCTGATCKTDDDEEDSWVYQEGLSSRSTREKPHTKRHHARAISREFESPRESQHILSKHRENVDILEDLRSSFELQKDKAKHDYDPLARKNDYCLQEFHLKGSKSSARKNRAMEKRDVLLKLMERKKSNDDKTFTRLQDTVDVLE